MGNCCGNDRDLEKLMQLHTIIANQANVDQEYKLLDYEIEFIQNQAKKGDHNRLLVKLRGRMGVIYTPKKELSASWFYVGQLDQHRRHGKGILISSEGYYEGLFKDDKPHDQNGIFRYLTLMKEVKVATIIAGKWVNGQLNQIKIYQDEDKFENNQFEIKVSFIRGRNNGLIQIKDGSQYDGTFNFQYCRNGSEIIDGTGILKTRQGDVYDGRFVRGKFQTFEKQISTLRYSNGYEYKGQFRQGRRNGRGRYYFSKNKFLDCEWVKDRPICGKLFIEGEEIELQVGDEGNLIIIPQLSIQI